MGCLSAALRLRFALIRKFSVSRDNAPPFNHDFAATGVPGPKAAASGPGAGRTWVQGSRSVGSGLGEPSACSQVHLRSIGQMSAGEKGRGREAAAPEMTGRRERTQGHRSSAGAQRPGPAGPQGHLHKQIPLRKSAAMLKASLEAQRPAKGLDNVPDINSSVVRVPCQSR